MSKADSAFRHALRDLPDIHPFIKGAAMDLVETIEVARAVAVRTNLGDAPADILALADLLSQSKRDDILEMYNSHAEARDEARLDITKDDHHGVYSELEGSPEPHWIKTETCAHCNLTRTPEGHDPCIACLPAVNYACCGHGAPMGRGYVAMQNGMVFRFDNKNGAEIREAVETVLAGKPLGKDWRFDR